MNVSNEFIEIVSNCCGVDLLHLDSDICSQCLEHCEPEELT